MVTAHLAANHPARTPTTGPNSPEPERTPDMPDNAGTVAALLEDTPDAGRDTCIARVDLILGTPVAAYLGRAEHQPTTYASEVARRMNDCASGLSHHAPLVRALVSDGWTLAAPRVCDDGEGYCDLVITLRKRYATAQEAQADLRRLNVRSGMSTDAWSGSWSFGWNENRTAAPEAFDSVDYWEDL